MNRQRWTALLCVLCVLLSGCATNGKKADGDGGARPLIYTSFFPVYDLVSQLAGDTAEVRSFMPPDKDPHLWEPTPKDLARLSGADLLVVNGANLERWLDRVRENLPNLPVLVLSDTVELITYKGAAAMGDFQYMTMGAFKRGETYAVDFGHTHEDLMRVAFIKKDADKDAESYIPAAKKIMEEKGELAAQGATIDVQSGKVYGLEMGHERGRIYFTLPEGGDWLFVSDRVSEKMLPYELTNANGELIEKQDVLTGSTSGLDKITYDPHSWLSPVNAKLYLNAVQDALIRLMPDNKRGYNRRKLNMVDELTAMQYEYLEKLKPVINRHFVVTHYAYAYLARDFGLYQFPLQGLISTESPSLKTIRKAIDICRHYHIDTIFYEYGGEQKSAFSLAEEIGGKARPLTSMEYVTKRQGEGKHYQDFLRENLEELYLSLLSGGLKDGAGRGGTSKEGKSE